MNKQKQILKTALKVFVELGFHGGATGKIAKEAGVANGTLFHYYKTKDELILALYINVKTELSEYVFNTIKKDANFKTQFKTFYVNNLEWANTHRLEFYFIHQFNNSLFLSLLASEEIIKHTKPQLEIIQTGMKNKVLKNISPQLILQLTNSHIYGVNQYLNSGMFSIQKKNKIINETFDLLWLMLT